MRLKDKIQKMLNLGFTCGQIGRICNCHGTTISSWMRGSSNLSKQMEESINAHIISFINQLNDIWK